MICGKTWKWMNDGGLVRVRQATMAAVGDEVITQLAVGPFDSRVDLFLGRLEPSVGHDQLEVLDQAFHAVVSGPLVGQRELLGDRDVYRPSRARFSTACLTIRSDWTISSIRTWNLA